MQQSKTSTKREDTDTSFNQVQMCCKQLNKAQLCTVDCITWRGGKLFIVQ